MLGKELLGTTIAAGLVALQVSAQEPTPLPPHPEGVAWPTDRWEEGALPGDVAETVLPLVEDAMARGPDDEMGQTRAVVIIHEGKLVLETYADGFGPETKQISWSMAKSITSALVGRAVQLGLIEDLDAPMPSPFAEDDPRSEITWRQWLTMTDGLDYTEIGAVDLASNDVVQMMYGPGRFEVTQYVVDELPLIHEPGTVWNYSTAGFHLIGWALQSTIGYRPGCSTVSNRQTLEGASPVTPCSESDTPMADWIDQVLFTPIGMDAQPEFDTAGTYLGGSLVWATARDFAKFGYLYLRDGVWESERLLPEGWVDFSRTNPAVTDANVYGAGWWLGAAEAPVPEGQAATSPPYDVFSAQGHEGQTIWVVPSRDLVVVRLGLMSNGGGNWGALYEWNQEVARSFPERRFASNSDEAGAASTTRP